MKRDIGQEILEGIREIKAYKAGKVALRAQKLKNVESEGQWANNKVSTEISQMISDTDASLSREYHFNIQKHQNNFEI